MKKILVFLAILCAIGCSGNVNSPQSGDPTVTTSQHDMTNDQLRNKIVKALDDMKAKAVEMGIQGVATASVLNKGETADWIGEMKVVGTPCNEKEGWNLVAIAWSKCGEVIATGADSGNPDHKKIMGELGFDTERTIGVYPGSSWTIVDTEDVLGVNLNIKPKR